MTSQYNYSQILYSLIPPLFSLFITCFSRVENVYFDRRAIALCHARQLNINMSVFIARVAKSSAALKNHMVSIFSGVVSILIAFNEWPSQWRYMAAIIVAILLLIFIYGSIWTLFSLHLDEMYGEKVQRKKPRPGKPSHHNYTYEQLSTVQQIVFNISLIFIILLGHYLSSSKTTP